MGTELLFILNILLTIVIILLLLNYDFYYDNESIKYKIENMFDGFVFLNKQFKNHLKDIYGYMAKLEIHANDLIRELEKSKLNDREIKIKIRSLKESIRQLNEKDINQRF